jgi:hypothetical protein
VGNLHVHIIELGLDPCDILIIGDCEVKQKSVLWFIVGWDQLGVGDEFLLDNVMSQIITDWVRLVNFEICCEDQQKSTL